MPKTTLAGHPLHTQLIVIPAGLLPYSLIMDLLHVATRKDVYADVAYHTMVGGLIGGLAAGVAGAADYLEIPRRSRSKRIANLHGALNLALLGAYGLNVLLRRRHNGPTTAFPLVLSLIGSCGLLISAWYGAELVYSHGVRVKGVSPIRHEPEVKPPGDEAMAKALGQAGPRVPQGGPVT